MEPVIYIEWPTILFFPGRVHSSFAVQGKISYIDENV